MLLCGDDVAQRMELYLCDELVSVKTASQEEEEVWARTGTSVVMKVSGGGTAGPQAVGVGG